MVKNKNAFVRTIKQRKVMIPLLIFLIVAVGAGVYYYAVVHRQKPVSTAQPATDNKSEPKAADPLRAVDVKYEQLNDDKLLEKINFLMGTKQYSEAEKLVKTQNGYTNNIMKMLVLANTQILQKKNTEASQTLEQASKLPNLKGGDHKTIGQAYVDLGQSPLAINAYQKAIDAYNSEKTASYRSEVEIINKMINELKD
jgi:hypothetical protein